MFDRILMLLEIGLLIWIVVQGEYVRYYEREVFRMNRERFEERAKWREQKRQQQLKKEIGPKTSGSSANTESLLPDKTKFDGSKTTDANFVEQNSPTIILPAQTISTTESQPKNWAKIIGALQVAMRRLTQR